MYIYSAEYKFMCRFVLKGGTFLTYQLQISNLSNVSGNWAPDYKTVLPSDDVK